MKEANIQAFIRREDRTLHLKDGDSRFISKDEFADWFSTLEQQSIDFKPRKPRLIHFLYEAGAFFLENKVREQKYYAVDTEFESVQTASISQQTLELFAKNHPSFEEYENSYQQVQFHLHEGNAYQINLTFPFQFDLKTTVEPSSYNTFMGSSKAASFAQSIYWPKQNITFLSNSPETLFTARLKQNGQWRVSSKPIKGTANTGEWEKLKDSKKDQAELLMITDLVKNDLNFLSGGNAIVDHLKERLDVPGLVHQFSEVSTEVPGSTSVGKLMRSLFPGGSITGAPKKRVCELIDEIEEKPRGFYCGSTLFWDGSGLSASINIRSGVIDWSKQSATLHAGGGVTVHSDCESEWNEMLSKLKSFQNVLTTI
ncbi:MAG: hypothetical protein COV38_14220 [Bdellovibrionales bacterium CG11_big_fil_rev_8_21_14_0_20_38_13]|nr:MAG: hypothetical protein COV38_14220 [Bdellovibrionales bacterium CG11_big_fil_rev_8_21_14_0_20_38_13]